MVKTYPMIAPQAADVADERDDLKLGLELFDGSDIALATVVAETDAAASYMENERSFVGGPLGDGIELEYPVEREEAVERETPPEWAMA